MHLSATAQCPAIYRSLVKVSLRYHLVASHDKPTFPFLLCLGVPPGRVYGVFTCGCFSRAARRGPRVRYTELDEHMYHGIGREASGGRLKARWRNHNYNHEIPEYLELGIVPCR